MREAPARGLSPLLFIGAGLCFLLPFAGVSCNTQALQQFGGVASQFGSQTGSSGGGDAAFNACMDALKNYNFATYSGVDLALGRAPSVSDSGPSQCKSLSGSDTGMGTPAPGQTNLVAGDLKVSDPGLLAVLGLIVLGLIISPLRVPYRWLLTSAAAAAAFVVLLITEGAIKNQVLAALTASITKSAGSQDLSSLGLSDFSSFFVVNMQIGLTLCLVALGAVVLLNVVFGVLGMTGNRPAAAPAGGPGTPPPPHGGYTPPAQPGGYQAPPPPQQPEPAPPPPTSYPPQS